MDDSNTAASTSTAATVANGARAVDDEKSATNLCSSTYSANTVKLLIKASNQQYDDHAIDGDLQWTVKRLKAHLADVYPSKPAITEQKLIYSGQLLNDNLILKDVIRNYKDICTQNHIIHLVCSTAGQSTLNKVQHRATTSAVGTAGNRNRNGNDNTSSSAGRDGQSPSNVNVHNTNDNRNFVINGSSANATNQSQSQYFHQQFPTYPSNYLMMWHQMRNMQYAPWSAASYPTNGQYGGSMPFMANQETAINNWIQQVYNQYMAQYLRAMHEPENTSNAASNDNNFVRIAANFPYFGPFVMPSNANPSVNMSPVITPTITPNNSHSTSNTIENPPAAPVNNVAEAQGPNPQQNDPQVPVIGRQFRNIPDDEPNNRDWLDSIFIVIRILLFVTIFYFNFSPVRYLIVITIATVIFCYHTGILRINHERNNNNVNRNNNAAGGADAAAAAAAAAAVDQIRQGVEQQDQTSQADPAAADGANQIQAQSPNSNNINTNTTVTMADRRSSIAFAISFLRTFVVTFFTSLLPETPAI